MRPADQRTEICTALPASEAPPKTCSQDAENQGMAAEVFHEHSSTPPARSWTRRGPVEESVLAGIYQAVVATRSPCAKAFQEVLAQSAEGGSGG